MPRNRIRSRSHWLPLLVLALGPAPRGLGAEPNEAEPDRVAVRAVTLQFSYVEGHAWKLGIMPGSVARLAIVFYGEPSHTLVGVLADRKFRDSQDGTSRLEKIRQSSPEAPVEGANLPDQSSDLRLLPFAGEDDRLSIWLLNDWSDGKRELRKITDATPVDDGFRHGYAVELSRRPSDEMGNGPRR